MVPEYQSRLASGADLKANVEHPMSLRPGERALIPTGIWLETPPEYEAQIRPRSGLAVRYGITVLNAPGTIDADYRGEVKVILVNLGAQDFTISRGDRIAQIVFSPVVRAEFDQSTPTATSRRGDRGFGSTGR